jgi:hypothetical protein
MSLIAPDWPLKSQRQISPIESRRSPRDVHQALVDARSGKALFQQERQHKTQVNWKNSETKTHRAVLPAIIPKSESQRSRKSSEGREGAVVDVPHRIALKRHDEARESG